ncbi:MAG: aldo/keto reductase [Spirochaetaceae bacterium]|jgi:aryl-alcohol dehydrogenase-like predicted oxidoreductase|nr:aldo/keto reductase [Spirochaetaceae bacterium]
MAEVTLGRTGITVQKDGFGALPIQRRTLEDALPILRRALDSGINFFDTARSYSDSEEKLGKAISGQRDSFIIASKSPAATARDYLMDLETSLRNLKTDRIDIYQFHNPEKIPRPGDPSGLYEAAQDARAAGKIRFIGISNHRLPVAAEAVRSGLYDTLQFPFNYLSSGKEEDLVALCKEKGVGFIGMKGLSGGLITDIGAARAWIARFDSVVPIWGIQTMGELESLIAAVRRDEKAPTAEQQARIEKDRRELCGEFCRSCGYCAPCRAGIKIFNCARMSLLLRRMPSANFLTPEWRREMEKIKDCQDCGDCEARCPYSLPIRELLKKNYEDYQTFL